MRVEVNNVNSIENHDLQENEATTNKCLVFYLIRMMYLMDEKIKQKRQSISK